MITIVAEINSDKGKVWDYWTDPKHIINWNFASPDWHCPLSENDLQIGGKFKNRMEAKDGFFGFDFEGSYTKIVGNLLIEYEIIDGRKVTIQFIQQAKNTVIIQEFEPETENSFELQQQGWQAILNNFKKYVEEINL